MLGFPLKNLRKKITTRTTSLSLPIFMIDRGGFFYLQWLLISFCAAFAGYAWAKGNPLLAGSMFFISIILVDNTNKERKAYLLTQQSTLKSLSLKEAQERRLLNQMAHDWLTGYPNRVLLENRLAELIENHLHERIALCLIHLNRFKEIHHTLGYKSANDLLKQAAARLGVFAEKNTDVILIEEKNEGEAGLAALENATFAILFKGNRKTNFYLIGEKIRHVLAYSFEYQEMSLDVNGTIGISIYPDHGDNPADLLQHAYVAIDMGATQDEAVVEYNPEIDPYSARRLALAGELKYAIMVDELELYYQPQLNLCTGTIIGAEALSRWNHPQYGQISPDEFIQVAEQTGVIHQLTHWVLDHALAEIARLAKKDIYLKISINLSAKNLQQTTLENQIITLLNKHQVSAEQLILEITETAIMLNPQKALIILNRLADQGIGISIDDFGTGYSSLAYLKQLPVKEVKIDRSFIKDMCSNTDDQIIVNTTLNMSHNLGLEVVAEGVEDQETLNLLTQLGCDIIQGYYLARPSPMADLENWLNHVEYATLKMPPENSD